MEQRRQIKYSYNKMLKHIIDLLQLDEFYEGSHDVQIAKGLYNYEKGIKGIYKQKKRMEILKKKNSEHLKKHKEWQKLNK